MIRLVIALLILGVVLDAVWPQPARDQAAASIAHAICTHNPAPPACAPGGRPADLLKPAVGLTTTPAPKEVKR